VSAELQPEGKGTRQRACISLSLQISAFLACPDADMPVRMVDRSRGFALPDVPSYQHQVRLTLADLLVG
jgi:hypothetical protein